MAGTAVCRNARHKPRAIPNLDFMRTTDLLRACQSLQIVGGGVVIP